MEHLYDDDTMFRSVSDRLLRRLNDQLDFAIWMVTRTSGDDWVVLASEGSGYGITNDTTYLWADTFCVRMVDGAGPRVAPDVSAVPAYLGAPISEQLEIGSYIGVPIREGSGELFGTLCAIDPRTKDPRIADALPTVELCGEMLGAIIAANRRADESERRAHRAELDAMTDPGTGLHNRRAWDRLLVLESVRLQPYGDPALVARVRIDGVPPTVDGDRDEQVLLRAAAALRESLRGSDMCARLDSEEFGVVLFGAPPDPDWFAGELQRRLMDWGVVATVGAAVRRPTDGLETVMRRAGERLSLFTQGSAATRRLNRSSCVRR